jgi:UDP-N-acetylmuramate dehydrogenase
MQRLDGFEHCLVRDVPLGPETRFGVGGRAEAVATPSSVEELAGLVRALRAAGTPWRVLGSGTNVLVPDGGVSGVVIRLSSAAFRTIDMEGRQVRAGAGASLADVISASCLALLSGLESLVGIPGTIGGAVRHNAGDRSGDLGQFVHSIDVVEPTGEIATRMRADLRFGYRTSNLDDSIITGVRLDLVPGKSEEIHKRVRRVWIEKKSYQPAPDQRAAYVFSTPRGAPAAELIQKAGAADARVGGAELSSRDPRFVVAGEGCTSGDIRRLIEDVTARVEAKCRTELPVRLDLW